MYLNIFRLIKDFFSNLFRKLSFENISILVFGIIIGFVMCFLIYFIFVLISLKEEEKKIINARTNVTDEKIERLIRSAKNQFNEESSSLNTGEKLNFVRDIAWELIRDIAKVYYPDSEYPIYELSIDELMILNHYITDRINSMFKGPILKPIKKLKIAYVLKILDIKKKIDENRMMKAANKLKVPGIMKTTMAVLNIFNPVYWVKKLMITTTLVAATNKISTTILDVVGEETNKVYSKSVFDVEKENSAEVEKAIYELETMIEE